MQKFSLVFCLLCFGLVFSQNTISGKIVNENDVALDKAHIHIASKSTLSKKVISEDLFGNKVEHESIADCARYLDVERSSIRQAIKRFTICKKHKIYLKGESAAKPLNEKSYEEGSETSA